MPNPTNNQVHVKAPLTNLSVAYLQNTDHFIAHKVFPNVPSQKEADLYYIFDREYFNSDEAQVRAPGTETAGSGYKLNTGNFFCKVYGFHQDIPYAHRVNADAVLNLDTAAQAYNMRKMLIKREVTFQSTYLVTGTWGTDITGVAASPGAGQVLQWNDASSDPIGDITAAKTAVLKATGFEPNTLTIGQEVFDALKNHPDIVDRVKYSGGVGNNNPAMITVNALAQLFELDNVYVAKAVVNNAEEGATESSAFIAGKVALLTYTPPVPGVMTPAAGYHFSWDGYLGTTNEFGIATSSFPMDHLKSERVETEMAYDQKLVSADLGYFFASIVA